MITTGTHHLTQRPQTIAECDQDGCVESLYMPEEMGVVHAGDTLARLGWDIGAYLRGARPALCPEHGEQTEACAHGIVIRLGDARVCQRCGKRREERTAA